MLAVGLSAQEVNTYRLGMDADVQPRWSSADSSNIMKLVVNAELYTDQDPGESIQYAEKALDLSRGKGFTAGIGRSLLNIGLAYLNKGNYKKSDSIFIAAYPVCKKEFMTGNQALLIFWNKNMGFVNAHKGEYEKAFMFYYNALAILQSYHIKDNNLRGMLYSDVGSLWLHVNQPQNSLYYLLLAEKLTQQAGNKKQLGRVYVNLGNAFNAKGELQKSNRYFRKAIALSSEIHDVYALQIAYISIAKGSFGEGQIDSATAYFKKAIATSEKTNPVNSQIIPYMYLSKIYLDNGDHSKALQLADAALRIARSLPSYTYVGYAQRLLAEAYEAKSDWHLAYGYLKSSAILLDSLTSDQKMGAANQLEIKYRTAEKDNQLLQQKLLITQKEGRLKEQNLWIWGISISSLLSIILFISLYRAKSHKQRLQQERITNLEKDQEIRRLKAVMHGEEKERTRIARELHDGIVSQLLAVKLKFKAAVPSGPGKPFNRDAFEQGFSYLEATTKDLRKTAHNLMPEAVLNAGLVKAVDDFCQKMGSEETSVNFSVVGSVVRLDQTRELALYRMVQELVQNAIKYAQASNILVQLYYKAEALAVTVEDNGDGLQNAEMNMNGGLKNMSERVKLMDGTMEITSSPDEGLTIDLDIPLNTVKTQSLYAGKTNTR
jgi:signal transduction histidine kinase